MPGTVKVAVVFTIEGSANSTEPGPLTWSHRIVSFSADTTSSWTEPRSCKTAALVTSALAPTLGAVLPDGVKGVEGVNVAVCSGMGVQLLPGQAQARV